MTFLPVVGPELRAESRRPFNYWLWVIGAGALVIVASAVLLPTLTNLDIPTNGNLVWNASS